MRGKTPATRLFTAALFLCIAAAAAAASPAGPDRSDAIPEIHAPGAFFQPPAGEQREAATLKDIVRASARLTAVERHDLGPLSASEALRLRTREAGDRQRVKIGIVRTPGAAVVLSGVPAGLAAGSERAHTGGIARREPDGRLSWTTAFISQGAGAVRLHVTEAQLPRGSRVYVYSERGEIHGPYAFDEGLRPEGFWTNSVAGEQVFLEVRLSAASGGAEACRLSVDQVAHLNRGAVNSTESMEATADTSCFRDASCVTASDFPLIDSATHSAAALEFQDGSSFFLCSGALIAAIGNSSVPYLLTANHCFDTQASATSLEAWWNFKTTTCNQTPFPNESGFPQTLGSTLLATGTTSDFTLVRISQNPPAGAFLLGWTTQDVSTSNGLVTYRLSHPAPTGVSYPQHVTRQVIQGSPVGACTGVAQGNYIYSTQNLGGTTGGSSGSPVYLADGSIVGQLFGKCGSNTSDSCDAVSNYLVDGAFRKTYPSVAAWLNPQGSGPCTASATALCLSGGRFRVTAAWQSATASGEGMAVQLTPDTGYFWFFSSTNVEMILKVLNACGVNNRYWVFAGGLTNVRVTVSVTDTQNGSVRTYVNPQNTAFQPIQDTSAFATCP